MPRDRPRLSAAAGGKFEASDPRQPADRARCLACGCVVLARVPKRAVVVRVDRERAVVTPTPGCAQLNATAGNESRFALVQSVRRIAGQPACVPNRRIRRRARHAVADGDVPLPVHRRTAHPAVDLVGRERGLFGNRKAAAGQTTAELVIPDGGLMAANRQRIRSYIHRMCDHQRLATAKIPVGQSVHQPVLNGVQVAALGRWARLLDDISPTRSSGVVPGHGHRAAGLFGERRIGRGGEVSMETEDPDRRRAAQHPEIIWLPRRRSGRAVHVGG